MDPGCGVHPMDSQLFEAWLLRLDPIRRIGTSSGVKSEGRSDADRADVVRLAVAEDEEKGKWLFMPR